MEAIVHDNTNRYAYIIKLKIWQTNKSYGNNYKCMQQLYII